MLQKKVFVLENFTDSKIQFILFGTCRLCRRDLNMVHFYRL